MRAIGGSGSDRRRRTAILYCRVTPEEREEIAASAADAGITVAELIRRRALGRPVLHRADARVVAELSKIGGLVKNLFNEGQLSTDQGRRLLNSLGAAANRIRSMPADDDP